QEVGRPEQGVGELLEVAISCLYHATILSRHETDVKEGTSIAMMRPRYGYRRQGAFGTAAGERAAVLCYHQFTGPGTFESTIVAMKYRVAVIGLGEADPRGVAHLIAYVVVMAAVMAS